MSERISIEAIPNMPMIGVGDDIGSIIVERSQIAGLQLQDFDILCVASKAVSFAEENIRRIDDIEPSALAYELHQKLPRKDVRAIQAIIDATGDPTGSRLEFQDSSLGGWIGGWLTNGLLLTSAGVDKLNEDELILLPENADESAKAIGQKILELTGLNIAVIITDSEGRVDKKGATQVAIGLYGIPPLRINEYVQEEKTKRNEETTCDMLAATAGLIMGQRGSNKPAVLIRGHQYEFNERARIAEALIESNALQPKTDHSDGRARSR